MYRIAICCAFLVIHTVSLYSANLDSAKALFSRGEAIAALPQFDTLARTDTGEIHTAALQMQAIIYEEYLGKIDSAQAVYRRLAESGSTTASRTYAVNRLAFLDSLGTEAPVYGRYRAILMSKQNAVEKASLLKQLLRENAYFVKKKELLDIAAALYSEQNRHVAAWMTLRELTATGAVIDPIRLTFAAQNAWRELLFFIAIAGLFIFSVRTILVARTHDVRALAIRLAVVSASWIGVIALYQILYMNHFNRDPNNPFALYAPIQMLVPCLIPLGWLAVGSMIRISLRKFAVLWVIPTILGMCAVIGLYFYLQPNAMVLIDSFQDRLVETVQTKKE